MKTKLSTIVLIFITCMFLLQLNSFAVIVSTDKEVNSGSGEVTVTVTSKQALGAYTLTLTDTAGLTITNASGGQVSADKKIITNSSDSGLTTLGTFTFKVPTVESDTTYNVKFSVTGMETPDLESIPNETNTAVIKVKGTSKPTPEPEPTPDPEPSKSSDTSLASLSISPFGKINKASSGIYDITVDNSLESVTITGVANDSGATIVSGNGTYNLEEGTNRFAVVVRAEDGSEESHTIRIIRKTAGTVDETTPPNVIDETNDPNNKDNEENKEDENKEDENVNEFGLSNLVITGLELNPTFASNVYEYKTEFSEDIDTLEVIATANQENAKVEIVGNSNLQIGENLITVIVTSEDGETTINYQITVTKHEPETVATSTTDENTTTNQALKNQVGKIILIAVAAIVAVILIGIIVIINTRKRAENDFADMEDTPSEKVRKGDFKVAVDEDESYKELEKLSNIHNNKNSIFDTQNVVEDSEEISENVNENEFEEILDNNSEENTGIFGENINNKVNTTSEQNNIFTNKNTTSVEKSTEMSKQNDIFGNTKTEENKHNDIFTNNNTNPTKPSVSDIWDNNDTDNKGGRSSKGKRFK